MRRLVFTDFFLLSVISVLIITITGTLFGNQYLQRERLVEAIEHDDFTSAHQLAEKLPRIQQDLFEGYSSYLSGAYDASIEEWSRAGSGSLQAAYNLGTLIGFLASTGASYDLTGLQQAAGVLTYVTSQQPKNSYAAHNLDVINQLIQQHPASSQQQQAQQQSGSEDEQQESTSQETSDNSSQDGANQGNQQGESQPDSALSDQQRQQLVQYQQYIEQQQLENQQFFGKQQQQPSSSGDPFLDMLLGNPGQFQQQAEQAEKDR